MCLISLLIFVATRDLYQNKPIYVPGTLWKVNEPCLFIYPNILIYSWSKGLLFCKLVDDVPTSICFKVAAVNLRVCLHEFNCGIHFPSYVTLDFDVLSYQVVISQQKAMVNRGDFIKVNSTEVKSYTCSYSSLYNCLLFQCLTELY